MSLFSSLTTAVSGLAAQSTCISNVSNNLANTSTTAYKAKGTSFEALVSASKGSSGGVLASTEYENDVQGTITSYDVSTYLALSGDGYFAARTAAKNADGSLSFSDRTYYTRRGDFTLDADGYLVNGAGYYLVGWNVDSSSGIVNTATTNPIRVSQLLDAPVATTAVEYAGNLPASAAVGTTTSTSTISVYDALGTSHDLSYYWVKTDTNEWDLHATVGDGAGAAGSDYSATLTYTFRDSPPVGTVESITTASAGATVSGTSVTFALNFAGAGAQSIASAFSNTTQYDDNELTVSTFSQNGIARGSFSSVTIDDDGYVIINYDNGQSKTYYEIPVVLFYAQNELKEEAGDAYSGTLKSGSPRFCPAGTLGAGKISDYSLESSNVDIATEFSSLIVAQQVYSANAKTISTVDSMLQTIMNIR